MASQSSPAPATSGEGVIVICFVVLTSLYLYESFDLAPTLMSDYVGPGMFPQLIAILGLILAAIYFFQRRSAAAEGRDEGERTSWREELWNLAPIGPIVLYVFLLEAIGFLFSTAIYVLVAMRVYGRSWMESTLYAIGFSVGFFVFFYYALLSELPMGRYIDTERILPFLLHLRRAIGG